MTTALPSPVKAPPSAANTGPSNMSKAAAAQQKMEAAFARMKNSAAKIGERREAIVAGLIATAEIQGATFGASFLSGWLHRKGKSMKVMGVDTRPVAASGMIITGLVMDKGGEHLLALGNGVMASWTAELAFDLGVKYATPKDAAAAATPPAATAPPAAAPATGDVPQVFYNGAVGDEVGRGRGGGGGGGGQRGRQIRIQRMKAQHAAETSTTTDPAATTATVTTATGEEIGDDEVGGLSPNKRISAHYKTWRVKNAKAQKAKRTVHFARLDAEAETHLTKALKIYQRTKKKEKIALPREWAWFATGRRPRPASDAGTATDTELAPESSSDGGYEWDDDGADLDAAVNDMSDEDMAALAGVTMGEDGDIGEDGETGDDMGEELGFDED